MTTIPQRLREIAKHIHECGLTKDSRRLKGIASELEAPAADAVPVAVWMAPDESAFSHEEGAHGRGKACTVPLIRQRDHFTTVAALRQQLGAVAKAAGDAEAQAVTTVNRLHAEVAALQARINELESRQVPASARDEHVVVWPDGGRCVGNTLKAAQDYMSGAVPSCAERGVEPPVIVRYVPAETVPYAPQQDTSKDNP